jgi:hypothetical protein
MEIERAPALLYREETGTSFYNGLTGLFNHGSFQLMPEREIKRSERQGKPLSLALLDIGGFNRYNLKHGYPAGDHLLVELAELLLENIRTIDLAARLPEICLPFCRSRPKSRRPAGQKGKEERDFHHLDKTKEPSETQGCIHW